MIVGFEISGQFLRAVCMERFRRGREPDQLLELPISTEDAQSLSEGMARLLRQMDAQHARVAIAIPSSWCLYRSVSFPFRSYSRVRRALRYALEGRLPGKVEEYIVEPMGEISSVGARGSRVLVAASPKERVKGVIDALRAAGADPCIIQPAVLALARYIHQVKSHNGDALVVRVGSDEADVALLDGRDEPIWCRTIYLGKSPALPEAGRIAEQIRFAVESATLTEGKRAFDLIFLIAPDAAQDAYAASLERSLGRPVTILGKGNLLDPQWGAGYGVAVAAVREGDAAPNLRQGELAYPPYAARMPRRLAVGAVLGVAIVGLALFHTGRMISLSRAELLKAQQLERSSFREALRQRSGTPSLAAMRAAVEQARKEADRGIKTPTISCLSRWVELKKCVPRQARIQFENIEIEPARISISAKVPDVKLIWEFRRALEASEWFLPSDPILSKNPDGGEISFTMDVSYRR